MPTFYKKDDMAKTSTPKPRAVKNQAAPKPSASKVENGLGDAIGYTQFSPFGLQSGALGVGTPGTEQVSNTGTLFKNLRWYLVSNMRQLLNELYVEIGLVQTIVDVPIDDALRGGFEIKSKQLGEEDIAALVLSLDRDEDLLTIGQAGKWNRLFGGAGVIIMTDQDPEEPLDLAAIGEDTPLEFRAVDMWELFWDAQNVDESMDLSGESADFEFYSYYGKKLHKSRVLRMKGMTAPSFIRPRLRGWGFSVVETLVRSINQYLKSTDLGFEVLDEFKLDVYKIKNLVNTLMSPNGQAKVAQRVQMANWQKNYQNAVVLDSEDDFDHKQLSFAGLGDAMAGIRMQVASDMRMPLTKLFGISSAGFNSGEDDIEVYNSMVESQVRTRLKPVSLKLIEVKCQKLFGFVPEDLSIAFKPLRVLGAVDEENVKTQKFSRAMQAKQSGEITVEEFRDICNKGGLFDVTLDTSDAALTELEAEAPEDTDGKGGDDNGEKATPKAGAKGGSNAAPNAKKMNAEWEESKHPRAEDGKFGKGGGKTSKGKEDKPAKKKPFKSFELVEPKSEGSKTESINKIITGGTGAVGSRGDLGKPSKIPYKSPKGTTCNMVGFVAFGKASLKDQAMLNEYVQGSEVLLSEMGIKFKTPLDFVCQNISAEKKTTAHFQQFKTVNPRVNIASNRGMVVKSILHEIGHAIDYALSDRLGASSAGVHLGRVAGTGPASPELQKLHGELETLLKDTDYFKMAETPFKRYLAGPTEIFARSFEVYAAAKAAKMVDEGTLPEAFKTNFRPDLFKTKDDRLVDAVNAQKTLQSEYNELSAKLGRSKDMPADELEGLRAKITEVKTKYSEVHAETKKLIEATGGGALIPEAKQKEYSEKIVEVMDKIFKLDSVKNALAGLFNSVAFDKASYEADGGDAQYDIRRKHIFDNPMHADQALWSKAKGISIKTYGREIWQYILWTYKKLGGKI